MEVKPGHSYLLDNYPERGPGIALARSTLATGFGPTEIALFHPEWNDGHSGSLWLGGLEYRDHCWFYQTSEPMRELV
jgi:hypothetical protein